MSEEIDGGAELTAPIWPVFADLMSVLLGAFTIFRSSHAALSGRILFCAAVLYVAPYLIVANVAETRVFAPFAIACTPWLAIAGAAWYFKANTQRIGA